LSGVTNKFSESQETVKKNAITFKGRGELPKNSVGRVKQQNKKARGNPGQTWGRTKIEEFFSRLLQRGDERRTKVNGKTLGMYDQRC